MNSCIYFDLTKKKISNCLTCLVFKFLKGWSRLLRLYSVINNVNLSLSAVALSCVQLLPAWTGEFAPVSEECPYRLIFHEIMK